jgi:D-sedoheptulose 7-phosphate isomerase
MTFSDAGHLTCVGNDFGFSQIFARGIEAFGKTNDWFIGLSTSGNSENIIEAIAKAKQINKEIFIVTDLIFNGFNSF